MPEKLSNATRGFGRPGPVRFAVTLITAVLSAAGTLGYFAVLNSDGFVGIFEWMTLPLFGLLFAWIAFSFLLATIGFVALSKERSWRLRWRLKLKSFDGDDAPDPVEVPVESGSTTAILMPIYNESPDRVFAGIRAMVRSLEAEQLEDEFELYVLSDTTQSEVWLREELAWSQLKEELEGNVQVHYRHRPRNKSRKAGNIADFVTRWGHRHEYMIVLDADSLVSAKTMRTMVSRMNADAYLGILQVPPTPIGRDSVFARLQQFSASVYGPVFVKGFSIWAGDEANYWGHNAIIRVAPFRQHCELPLLPGSAPLGGEILSHDFVEAALMLRSGWKVQVATDIGGSYEECPTTLADYAQRDQRWCQGNLQHSKLLVAENYRPLSRFHFACGVMSYIASPLWMLFTVLCVLATIRNVAAGDESVGANPAGAVVIFGVTMTLLLLPKLWCLLLLTMSRQSVHRYGGDLRLWTSAAIEVIASVLLSPIMAIFHTRFVLGTLLGKNVRWNAQQRDERGVSWSEAASQFAWPSFIACLLTSIMAWSAPGLLLWFSPLLAGVIVSIPLAVLLGSTRVGNWLKRHYLLATPEELRQPEIVQLHREAVAAIEPHGVSQPLFKQFVRDPALFHLHRAIQRTTDADVELPRPRQEQIAAVVGESHVADIPEDCRFDILCNADLHQDLHVEQQV